jgi:hypothetical protein
MRVSILRKKLEDHIPIMSSSISITPPTYGESQAIIDWFETPLDVLIRDFATLDKDSLQKYMRGYEDSQPNVYGLQKFFLGHGIEAVGKIVCEHPRLLEEFDIAVFLKAEDAKPDLFDSYYLQPEQNKKVKFHFSVFCCGRTQGAMVFTVTCIHGLNIWDDNCCVFFTFSHVDKRNPEQEAKEDREFLAQFGMTRWSDFDLSPYDIVQLENEYTYSFTDSLNEMVLASVANPEYADLRSNAKRKQCSRKNPQGEKSLSKTSKTGGKKGKRSVDLTPY